jgi:ElaB/YqjD/DUF883 family membrane-anchored ribosome-binding protein
MADWNDGSSADNERSFGQAGKSADADDPAAIRAGINETRARMSDTLSELGERLNPHVVREQVTERVKEGIREATIGRVEHMARSAANTVNATRSGVTDTIRDNPVPAAMVAIGLAWLMFNGKRDTYSGRYDADDRIARDTGPYSRSSTFAGSYPYDMDYEESESRGGRASRVVGDVRERVSHAAENVADSVKDRAGQLADRGRDLVDRAGQTASSVATSVSSRAQDVSRSVAERSRQSARRIEDTFYENPLAIGAVAVAIGVMAGLAAPVSGREVELMGDAREKVGDRVSELASEAKDKARNVAGRVVDETKRVVTEAVKDEGMSLGGSQGGQGGLGTQGISATAQNPS